MFLFLGSVALIFIGSFLPWGTFGPFSVSGTEGDGVITIILSIIALVVYFALQSKPKVVKFTKIGAGVLSLIIAFMSFSGLGELEIVSPGGGLIMVLIGAIGLTVSGFMKQK